MKIHFLGTCSGTEPMPGIHHCSLIMEVNGILYWFDAGENCAHAAYTSGLDIMKTKALFVSHPHIDHIGGLPNLLFCLEKLTLFDRVLADHNRLQIYFPDLALFEAVKAISDFKNRIVLQTHHLFDGVIFEDENIKVTAAHNLHLGIPNDGEDWRSYSFLIETDGKRVIFSGDVKQPEDLDAIPINGADILIMETGHHKPVDVCNYALTRNVKNLRLNHHGRIILNDRPAAEALAAQYSGGGRMSVKICYDGMVETF